MKKYKLGILAFGSLIDNPGKEIEKIENIRIICKTPFKVEFARISSKRSNAPTLIPVKETAKGKKVKSVIIVLNNKITLEDARSILWRRECHITDIKKNYREKKNPTSKDVIIKEYDNFPNVDKVVYTSFLLQEEYNNLTPEKLAELSISSILSDAGKKGIDGIRYLLSTKNSGIITELSEEYEKLILNKTKTKSLNETIENLDKKRQKRYEKL